MASDPPHGTDGEEPSPDAKAAADSSAPSGSGPSGRAPDDTKRAARWVAVLTIVVFLPSVLTGYVFDDLLLIAQNPHAQSIEHIGRPFTSHLWDVYHMGGEDGWLLRYYRPLVAVSYMLNWVTSGGAAWTFHLTNALIHGGAVFLAVRVGRRWAGALAPAVVAALIFGLHATRTEAVIWIAGRTDVMMFAFALACVELLRGALAATSSGRRYTLLASSILCGVAAFLCKEGGAFVPLLLIIDYFAAPPDESTKKRHRSFLAASVVLPLGYLLVRLFVYPVSPAATVLTPKYALLTWFAYAERIVWPWPQTLFHRPLVIVDGQMQNPSWTLVAGGLVAAGYVFLLARAWRRDKVAGAILLAALAFLGPLLNITRTLVPVTVSDRFLYAPLWLFTLGVARLYLVQVVAWARVPSARLAFGALLVAHIGVVEVRMLDYVDDDSFWRHELDVDDKVPTALRSAGRRMAREGDVDKAYEYFRRSITPPATNRVLLATPFQHAVTYMQMLGLQAARVPDGDLATLQRVYADLDTVFRGYPPGGRFPSGFTAPEGLFDTLARRHKGLLAAELSLVATRLDRPERARELLAMIEERDYPKVANMMNVALAYARVGDYEGAERTLRFVEDPPPPWTGGDKSAAREARQRFNRARTLRAQSSTAPNAVAKAMMLSQADAELGLYLVGARRLSVVYAENPGHVPLAQLYTQLLLAARLEQEALGVVSKALGPEKARGVIAGLRDQLPPRLKAMPPAKEPVRWRVDALGEVNAPVRP